jgi:hypothetical protein
MAGTRSKPFRDHSERTETARRACQRDPRDVERIVALRFANIRTGFQHMADVKVQLQALKEESDSGLCTDPALSPNGKLMAFPGFSRGRTK